MPLTHENARSVWVQIFEWQEGHLATGNQTSSLLGVAKRINLPAEHPTLAFARACLAEKDRWYNAHDFSEHAAGRALVR